MSKASEDIVPLTSGQQFRVIEAKDKFEANGLAHLAAQMYDLLINNSSPFVLGILCTGTTWLYFRMDLEETSSTFPHATMR